MDTAKNGIIFVYKGIEMRNFFAIIFTLVCLATYGQVDRQISESITDCDGAINILNPGDYSLTFTGKIGYHNDLNRYAALKEHPETNALWCSFVAPFSGKLSLSAFVEDQFLEMVIFKESSNDICGDVLSGYAEMERMMLPKTADTVGLRLKTGGNFMYPISMLQGETVLIYFNIQEKKIRPELNLKFNYDAISNEAAEEELEKIVDQRRDKTAPHLNIKIRDAETGLPVSASLRLKGTKRYDAMYRGSDFYFPPGRAGKVLLEIDCEGYFFLDREEPIASDTDHEVVIWIEPLGKGKRIEMAGIEFRAGTSDFMPGTENKLRRLKDFLSLNSEVNIEIQGHVHSVEENSMAAKKISEARAKRVQKYLVENGIEKSRLSTEGFGNSEMIYPEPKFAYEEQANRRVEIKIL